VCGGHGREQGTDPARYATASDSPEPALSDLVEQELDRYVAERNLVELSGAGADPHGELASRVGASTGGAGVEALRVEIGRIEVRLDSALLGWAERLSTRRPPAPERLARSA
jgi:regulator of protease activity HflC (stomatin/prohibitin superfamily)